MKTKRPIDAKNTPRLLSSILPAEFNIVNNKNSNGYKFINLLYGVEVDFVREKIIEAYNNSFLTTYDFSSESVLYEARLSGIPNGTHLISDIGNVKITDDNEFYNGDPTRVIYLGSIPLNTSYIPSGIIGLNYFRKDERGSGYLLLTLDIHQEQSYLNSSYPSYKIDLTSNFDTTSDILNYSGFFTGIATQSYTSGATDEILVPISSGTLAKKYPLSRQVKDENGAYHIIDHYEPYLGWIKNEVGTVLPVLSYSGTYFYDEDGNKIYHRTAKNNPYGFGNYTTAYLDLRYTPISGTLKFYDLDILDISGNAIEIPSAGKTLYYLQSDRMNSSSGVFDPTYLGYDSTVPYDRGFGSYMEGEPANPLKVTSWSYLHEGGKLNEESLQYEDGTGPITNRIKIVNPQSRYLVEYKYKLHDYSRYITTLDAINFINIASLDPIYSLYNISGNLVEREYEFTKDPSYVIRDKDSNIVGYENSKIITLNGMDVRPGKTIQSIDFNLPVLVESGPLSSFKTISIRDESIGYTRKHVPVISTQRICYMYCPFDQQVFLNTVTESDLTGNSNNLVFQNTGTSTIYRINYDSKYGKKIIRGTGNSFFGVSNVTVLKEYVHFAFGCKIRNSHECILLDIHDNSSSRYLNLTVSPNGLVVARMNGYKFVSNKYIDFGINSKEFIIRYRPDDVSPIVPYIEIFYKDSNQFGFEEFKLFRSEDTPDTVSSSYLRCFKNCNIDIDYLRVYTEVF
jgi:hypothetical protein